MKQKILPRTDNNKTKIPYYIFLLLISISISVFPYTYKSRKRGFKVEVPYYIEVDFQTIHKYPCYILKDRKTGVNYLYIIPIKFENLFPTPGEIKDIMIEIGMRFGFGTITNIEIDNSHAIALWKDKKRQYKADMFYKQGRGVVCYIRHNHSDINEIVNSIEITPVVESKNKAKRLIGKWGRVLKDMSREIYRFMPDGRFEISMGNKKILSGIYKIKGNNIYLLSSNSIRKKLRLKYYNRERIKIQNQTYYRLFE